MDKSSDIQVPDLEAEYVRIKTILYKNLFLYIATITLLVIMLETVRAFVHARVGIFIVLVTFLAFGALLMIVIWRLETNQELSITIFLLLFFIATLLAQFYTKSGYFDKPMDSFNFAYAFAVCERLVIARISKFPHRTLFIVGLTIVRVFVLAAEDVGLFIMQFVYLFFTIYLDADKEKYDKKFFLTYFQNKEQLIKFKNLVVQDIPESIIIITQDLMQCLFVNNSFKNLLGANLASDIRTQLNQFLVQETQEENESKAQSYKKQTFLTFLETTINSQRQQFPLQKFSCNLTYKLTDSNNQQIQHIFEAKTLHLVWDEQPAIVIILHDITQQHTILTLKIADAHKDTVLATVSHELRTPLNSILGMIQIMQKRIIDNDLGQYLIICKNSANLLLSLVNSILDLNQIRAKKLKLCPEKVNLYELLQDIVKLFEFQCAGKGLYLKLKIAPSVSKFIVTDKNRLSQVLINLVGNALKFTREGGITISAEDSLEYIKFSVEDTGAGIRDEDKSKLFQTFGKLDHADQSMNPHGVGLGLTISDKLVRLLGGSLEERGIQLKSQFGRGSKFTFFAKKNINTAFKLNNKEPSCESLLNDHVLEEDDEKGEVHHKMITYSRPFVKEPRTFSTTRTSFPNSLTQNCLTPLSKDTLLSFSINNLTKDKNGPRSVSPCVLVVDDNLFNVTIAQTLISSNGYKVKTAVYGQTAIEMVQNCNFSSEPIRLILMDCQMPIMDGYETTEILKKMMQEKKIPEIPIVAVTANDSFEDREICLKAGMCEYLTKPLNELVLTRILARYMAD